MEEFITGLDGNGVATVSVIGQSSEGLPLYQVKVSTGLGQDGKPKPAIFLDSNIHARGKNYFISQPFCQILENYQLSQNALILIFIYFE